MLTELRERFDKRLNLDFLFKENSLMMHRSRDYSDRGLVGLMSEIGTCSLTISD